MKTRNGFVSNSSSASFVIKREPGLTVSDLATIMIAVREYDDDDILIEAIENRKDLPNDIGICFSSYNYWTYILPVGDYFVIQTCHNHPFIEVLPDISRSNGYPDDLIKHLKEMGMFFYADDNIGDIYESICSFLEMVGVYWYPEIGTFFGRSKLGSEYDFGYPILAGQLAGNCKNHQEHFVLAMEPHSLPAYVSITNKLNVCPLCFIDSYSSLHCLPLV